MNLLLNLLRKGEHLLARTNKWLARRTEPQYKILERWYKDDPHSLKRSTFNHLNENSIVFDLGGYEGQWTSDVFARYRCNVYVFEPVRSFAQLIRERFEKNPKIKVFQVGLAHDDLELDISIKAFASSVISHQGNEPTEKIILKKFSGFLSQENIPGIDLIKINIEGSEFDLLEKMIEDGTIQIVNGLLVQFHNFVENAEQRMQAIRQRLGKTHRSVYEYPYIWEYWEKI
jgi:FkbM family methyltransferase